jgi:hypothetical protein
MFTFGVVVLLVVLAVGGWWMYRRSFGGEMLPGPLGSLQRHFAGQGLKLDAALVRHPQLNEVHKSARFRTTDGRLFYVYWCQDAAAAQKALAGVRAGPTPSLNAARGPLVIFLTEWPAGDALAQQVLAAFERWPIEG